MKSLAWLFLAIVTFYWKIIFTNQFSLLTDNESVSQAYSWLRYWSISIRQLAAPLWNPYTFGGRSAAGEMQTAAFYPLHLVFALFPLNRYGFIFPALYHWYFVAAHIAAAFFMFVLVRELGLSRFAAVVGGLCFSTGGFVGWVPWPHMLESSLWLPLLFVFVLRMVKASSRPETLVHAAFAGLMLGMAVLAGGLHVVMMEAIVVLTASIYYAARVHAGWRQQLWLLAALGVVAMIGFGAGAVQLLPSIEYSQRAVRWMGELALPATQKIPYSELSYGLWPRSLTIFLFPWSQSGAMGSGEDMSPYFGVFPLVLAVLGVWKRWDCPWVRYASGLSIAAILFSLGSFSLVHGLAYVVVPYLWMAREAIRFLLLAHFGLTMLVAFGAETLFLQNGHVTTWKTPCELLKWLALACAAVLLFSAVSGVPSLNNWTAFSFLVIFLTFGLFRLVAGGWTGGSARFMAVALILFDLGAFNWSQRSKAEVARAGTNYLDRLASMRDVAAFLKSRPQPFRVQVLVDPPPNIGDAFGIQALNGGGVTMAANSHRLVTVGSAGVNLLNTRYFLRPAGAQEPNPVYADTHWKVYENPGAYPRAWLVHRIQSVATTEALVDLLQKRQEALHDVALVSNPIKEVLQQPAGDTVESASMQAYSPSEIKVGVQSSSQALLILSEAAYPGWIAWVNGERRQIHEVDGGLRAVVVPGGFSEVVLRYRPMSVYIGSMISAASFAFTFFLVAFHTRKYRFRRLGGQLAPGTETQLTESRNRGS